MKPTNKPMRTLIGRQLNKHLPASSSKGRQTIKGLSAVVGIVVMVVAVIGGFSLAAEEAHGSWWCWLLYFPLATVGIFSVAALLTGGIAGEFLGFVFFSGLISGLIFFGLRWLNVPTPVSAFFADVVLAALSVLFVMLRKRAKEEQKENSNTTANQSKENE